MAVRAAEVMREGGVKEAWCFREKRARKRCARGMVGECRTWWRSVISSKSFCSSIDIEDLDGFVMIGGDDGAGEDIAVGAMIEGQKELRT